MPNMFNRGLSMLLVGVWLFFTSLQLTAASSIYEYYILNPRIENGALSVISLADRNTIHAGTTTLNLDRYQAGSIPAGSDLTPGIVISATGSFTLGSQVDATDLPVPGYFIGTKFIIPHYRNDHTYYILSPKADAQVTITVNGIPTVVTALQDQVLSYSAGSTNNISGLIQSDQPILVAHAANNSLLDVYPVPPVAKELWGIRSTTAIVGAMEDNTAITVTGSSGVTESFTLNAGSYRSLTIAGGTQGSGSAAHIVADKPIAAIQIADSDSGEATAFLDTPYLATHYALPIDTQYVAVVCPQLTNVTLTNGAVTETQTCTGDGIQPGKAYFGSVANGININAGAYLEADRPVYIYYEASASNDEHNITGRKDNYYSLNSRFQSGPLNVMSLVDNNWITAGSSTLFLNQHELGTIAGSELLPGIEILGTGPFTLGSEVDGTDLPVPGSFAGTTFVVPHARDTHTYYLSSPYGEANVSVDIGSMVSNYVIAIGQVLNINAGSDTTTAGIIKSDRPILVSHQAGISGDAYPVPPAATELWGVRTGSVSLAAAEDNTIVQAYTSDSQTTTYTLTAGVRQSVNIGANTSQGQGAAIHLIADKPIAAYQLTDSDGYEATAFFQEAYHGNRYGLPVDTQYVAIVCPTPGTNVTLYEVLKVPGTQTCTGIADYPGKLYFGSAINGTNIAAGSYLDADQPIYVIYESSATNDEHNLLGYNSLVTSVSTPPILNTLPETTNDNPLVITGLAAPGQTVRIYVNNDMQGMSTASVDGMFNYDAKLLDGDNEIYVVTWINNKESRPTPTSTVDYQNKLVRKINSSNANLIITSNTVWTQGIVPLPYTIAGTLVVDSGATLTIQPGVFLKFDASAKLEVNGVLVVQGAEENNVVFTSSGSRSGGGEWYGITLNSNSESNKIEYADIRYAQYGVYFNGGSQGTVTNSTVTANDYGFYITSYNSITNTYSNPVPIVTNNNIYDNGIRPDNNRLGGRDYYVNYGVFSENTIFDARNNWWGNSDPKNITARIFDYSDNTSALPAVVDYSDFLDGMSGDSVMGNYLNGPFIGDTTLFADTTYDVLGKLYVPAGSTLTIEQGAILRFAYYYHDLIIDGSLVINGGVDNKVTFTSNQSTPYKGDWGGIQINNGAPLIEIDNAVIEYSYYGIYFNDTGSIGTVTNSDIRNNANYGLRLLDASPTVTNSRMQDNMYGIYISGNSSPEINSNNIITENQYGIYVYGGYPSNPSPIVTGNSIYNNATNYFAYNFTDAKNVSLDAKGNWWGSVAPDDIAKSIFDYSEQPTYSPIVNYTDYLDSAGGNVVAGNFLVGAFSDGVILAANTTYIALSDLLVPAGVTLTIEQGAVIQFVEASTNLTIEGNLIVSGAPGNEVKFTSSKQNPAANNWDGIKVNAGGTVTINYAVIEYARYGLYFYSSTGTVRNSLIQFNGVGVYITGTSTPELTANRIINNSYGVQIASSGTDVSSPQPVITGNDIYGNFYQLYIAGFAADNTISIIATDNWWGVVTPQIYSEISGSNLASINVVDFSSPKPESALNPVITTFVVSEANISPEPLDGSKDSTQISASISAIVDWAISIKDETNNEIRTFSGTGNQISQVWDGNNAGGAPVDDGVYTVVVSALDAATGLSAYPASMLVTVNKAAPIASITSPVTASNLSNRISIIGTASSLSGSVTYKLEYENSLSPGIWTLIKNDVVEVSNGLLGTWDTNSYFDEVLLPNGDYSIRLTVTDVAGNTASEQIAVVMDNMLITNIVRTNDLINPYINNAATINFDINQPANVTIHVVLEDSVLTAYPDQAAESNIVRNISMGLLGAGSQTISWDGRNDAGEIVRDDVYKFVIEAQSESGYFDKVNIYNKAIIVDPYLTVDFLPDLTPTYNPYKNEPVLLNFTLREGRQGHVCLIAVYRNKLGTEYLLCADDELMMFQEIVNVAYWDGRDNYGDIVSDVQSISYTALTKELDAPKKIDDNYIIVEGGKPVVPMLSIKSDPYVTYLSYSQITKLKYRLDTDANVTVSIKDPDTGARTILLDNVPQTVGDHEVPWEGSSSYDGLVFAEGQYTFIVKATNPASGVSTERYGNITIFQ